MITAARACAGCARDGAPLVTAGDGRELCLACVEAATDHAGVDADALAMLRWLTRIACDQPKS